MTHCPHCNGLLRPTHSKCVCDPREWRDPENIPPPCAKYEPQNATDARCKTCEHDMECH